MLSILIPTYNERANILPLVRAIEASVTTEHEIIIIDDNSPDGTAAEVMKAKEQCKSLRLVKRAGRLGLTGAVRAGLQESRGERIIVMDADLSHPPESLQRMYAMLDEADIVVGSRLMAGGGVENWPIHRKLMSGAARILAILFVNPKCSDPLSGFFAARREVMLATRFRTKGYKLLLNIIADNRGARISEMPYRFRDRVAGKTKLDSMEILNFVADLMRIDFG